MFFLGTPEPVWLARTDVPLFVSHRRLMRYTPGSLPRATAPWALDSGGFTELSLYGEWRTTPREYVTAVRRYVDELGSMPLFASPQDWMNEPVMLAKTGKTVEEHQRLTVDNFLELRSLAPDLPFIPVLQGWEPDDYLRCVALYDRAGVVLEDERVVGLGTVCRRQDTSSALKVLDAVGDQGIRLHGFGVKTTGLLRFGHLLHSSDSMAWSYRARRAASDREAAGLPRSFCGKNVKSCANCMHFAIEWRSSLLEKIAA